MRTRKTIYALYKGEELLGIGTAEELAEQLKVSIKTIYFYHSPANAKREKKGKKRILINLD